MHREKRPRKQPRSKRATRTTRVTTTRRLRSAPRKRTKPLARSRKSKQTPMTPTVARSETSSPVQPVASPEPLPFSPVACVLASDPTTPAQVRWTTRAQMIVLVLMVAVMLVVAYRPSQPGVAASVAVQPEIGVPAADVAMPRFETQEIVRPIAISEPAEPADATVTSARKSKTMVAVAATKGMPSEPVKETPPAPVAPPSVEAVSTANTMDRPGGDGAESRVAEHVEQRAAVTISGCVETGVNDTTFRLTDTGGSDAPKSRSWRSGFLRKRTAPVALIDSANALRLQNYLGRRITATGLLMNREMQVQSLLPAGASCG